MGGYSKTAVEWAMKVQLITLRAISRSMPDEMELRPIE
jgi:hypothetical protein